MEINAIHCGDAIDILRQMPEESINCCVTSPPYYGLRDYGHDGQVGLEKTPDEFITRLVDIFREVKRVLKSDGTLWINIGDSYAGSRKGGATHPSNAGHYKQGSNRGLIGAGAITDVGWGACKPKDLIGIPWMLAFALRADGWFLRQEIIWSKPNPMPESVKDRCTKAHEQIFLLSKSAQYYYDAEAIAEPVATSTTHRLAQDVDSQAGSNRQQGKTNGAMKAVAPRYGGKKYTETPDVFNRTKSGNAYDYRPYRNKRSVWEVATHGYTGAHFATFPPKLIVPCVLAGCPEGGIVVDPFLGSGTTGVVAKKHGRNYIGIDINPNYCALSKRRIAEEADGEMQLPHGGKARQIRMEI